LEQALVLGRDIEDAVAEGSALVGLGYAAHDTGNLEQAVTLFEQGRAVFRDAGHLHGEADAVIGLGWIQLDRDEPDQALRTFRECVVLAYAHGRMVHLADALAGLAAAVGLLHARTREPHDWNVAALFGAAEQLRDTAGPPYYLSGAIQQRFRERLRLDMDADSWTAAWTAGRARSLDAAVALALDLAQEQ
jgi:hypothetical protein